MMQAFAYSLIGQAGPYIIGRMCGAGVVALLLLAGILKCVQVMRRPTTSTTCVLSLTLALVGWLCGGLGNVLTGGASMEAHSLARVMVVLLMLGLAGAGLILGIVGRVQYSQRKAELQQGRSQAVWGILLSGLTLALPIGGFVLGAVRAARDAAPEIATSAEEFIAFEDYNFRVRTPERPWVQLDVKKINKDATLGFMRRKPDVGFMVIAERFGVESDLSTAAIAAVAEANLRQGTTRADIGAMTPETVDGVEGLRFLSTVTVAGRIMSYSHWTAAHNGYCWQLIAWGDQQSSQEVQRSAHELSERFELIDPQRVHHGSSPAAEDVQAPQFGYVLHLAGSGWSDWIYLAADFPTAHSGALQGSAHAFAVVPLRLDGFNPSETELSAALLATLDMKHPSGDVTNRRPFSHDGATGCVFNAARNSDGTDFIYRLHVLRAGDYAYLLAAWCVAGDEKRLAKLDAIVQRVEFFPGETGAHELTAKERKAQSQLFDNLGLLAFEARRLESAAEYLRHAFSYDPDNEELLNTVVDVYDQMERYDTALAFLDEHIERFPDSRLTRANRAYQLARTGRRELAVEIYGALFEDDFTNEIYLGDYLDQLSLLGRFDVAHRAVDAALARAPSVVLRLRKAHLLQDQQDYAGAIRFLREAQQDAPFDAAVGYSLAECHWSAGEYADGLAACERLIDNDQGAAYVYFLKGRCELDMKRIPEAKASFENAVRFDPADEDYRRFLEHASGLLGHGDNRLAKTPIEPVEIPELIQTRLADLPAAASTELEASSDMLILSRLTGVEFETGAACKTTEYRTVRLQTRQGISECSTLTFPFDPLAEEIFVNWLTVKDAEGVTVATGDVDSYYAIDDLSEGAVSQAKVLHMPVPGLAPGHVLDYAVTIRRVSPPDRWPYRENVFIHTEPVCRHVLFARGEIEQLVYESDEEIRVDTAPGVICWSMTNQPVYRWEPLQARYDTWLPIAAFADARDTWPEIATAYLESIADRFEPDESTQALARRLTEGLSDQDEMLFALARHVQHDYTYNAIEFGQRARIPNRTEFVIRSRYGDCKDHALLLQQLIRAVDLQAHLALMNTSTVIRPGLPSLDQFNHMVVYAGVPEGARFIDVSNKSADPTADPTAVLADKQVLVLDPNGPRLIKTAAYPEGAAAIRLDRRVEIVNEKDASVEETVTFAGICAEYMRDYLRLFDPSQRREAIQQRLASYGGPQLRDLAIENLDATDLPLELRLAYRVSDIFHASDAELAGTAPAPWESECFQSSYTDERTSPFELFPPLGLEVRIRVAAPAGWRLADATPLTRRSESPYFEWNVVATGSPDALMLEGRVRRATGRFGAEQYEDYRQAAVELLGALSPRIVLHFDK